MREILTVATRPVVPLAEEFGRIEGIEVGGRLRLRCGATVLERLNQLPLLTSVDVK